MRKLLLSLCFAVMFASGCAKPGLVGSYCGPLPEQNAVSAIAADAARTMATELDSVSAVCLFMIVVPLDVCDRPQRGKLSHPEILILIRELSNEHARGVPQPWAG